MRFTAVAEAMAALGGGQAGGIARRLRPLPILGHLVLGARRKVVPAAGLKVIVAIPRTLVKRRPHQAVQMILVIRQHQLVATQRVNLQTLAASGRASVRPPLGGVERGRTGARVERRLGGAVWAVDGRGGGRSLQAAGARPRLVLVLAGGDRGGGFGVVVEAVGGAVARIGNAATVVSEAASRGQGGGIGGGRRDDGVLLTPLQQVGVLVLEAGALAAHVADGGGRHRRRRDHRRVGGGERASHRGAAHPRRQPLDETGAGAHHVVVHERGHGGRALVLVSPSGHDLTLLKSLRRVASGRRGAATAPRLSWPTAAAKTDAALAPESIFPSWLAA
jgi:hypothetical protein